ncbi:MAG TPA: hypothetical protein VI756_04865, partial [Blastocatellia bacterium]
IITSSGGSKPIARPGRIEPRCREARNKNQAPRRQVWKAQAIVYSFWEADVADSGVTAMN